MTPHLAPLEFPTNTPRQAGAPLSRARMQAINITDREFEQFRTLIHQITGINLSPAKKALVSGRLSKRLRERAIGSYAEYYRLVTSGKEPEELQTAVDLLTTNETQFFRESKHFDFLRDRAAADAIPGLSYRVWSAACSTGEEPYSIAMTLANCLGEAPWEVVGSDISMRALGKARAAHYPLARAKNIPRNYLTSYCLKGIGPQRGTFLIDKMLRSRVQLLQINLNAPLPKLGTFHVIFLRNVMIYFDLEVKRLVVNRVLSLLKPRGYFIVGHSESLNGVAEGLRIIAPSIYQKP